MKAVSIFFCLLLFVACSVGKLVEITVPIAHINDTTIHFDNNETKQLPTKKKEQATIIYLMRHAEKAKSGERDPLLTQKGSARAARVSEILAQADIDQIYSTDYQRTQLTAKPTAERVGQSIQSYNPRQLSAFADQLKKEGKGQRIFVVGHSNTTPTLVNALIGEEKYPALDESVYDHFYIVILENGKAMSYSLRI